MKNTIYIGSDHGGFELKNHLKTWLEHQGYSVKDLGAEEFDPKDDYPQYAIAVAQAVVNFAEGQTEDDFALGIIVCRSSGGVTVAANKVVGARAVAVYDVKSAVHAREHNNANIATISGDWLSKAQAEEVIKAFLTTSFNKEERHLRRLQQIANFEKNN
jgi:ribose 5-phosphate isomerase B